MSKPKVPDSLSEKAKQLLAMIPYDGSFVGNTFLRRRLGWPDNEYWEARDELLDAKLIHMGKGRGGSVGKNVVFASQQEIEGFATGPAEAEVEAGHLPSDLVADESDLYEPLKKWVQDNYGRTAKEQGDFFEVKITASPSGRKRESGKWSRPDLTSVEVSTYDFLPEKDVEITSFEVKRYDDAENLQNIYEAASHSRWSHYTYLVLEDSVTKPLALSERFEQELIRFEVGLVRMAKSGNSFKFEEIIEPEYHIALSKDSDGLLREFFEGDRIGLRKFKKEIGK